MQDQSGTCETAGQDAPIPLRGKDEDAKSPASLNLLPVDSSDLPYIRAWRNDYRIWRWCRQNDLISDVEQSRWFEAQSKDPTIKMYKIALNVQKDGKNNFVTVGVCGLTSIDLTNRRAEFSLYVAPEAQGNDIGKQGLSLLLLHSFKNLGLHLIYGEVFDGNPALKVFEELGFRREGLRRDFYFRDGKFIDAHLISIKASEWI